MAFAGSVGSGYDWIETGGTIRAAEDWRRLILYPKVSYRCCMREMP